MPHAGRAPAGSAKRSRSGRVHPRRLLRFAVGIPQKKTPRGSAASLIGFDQGLPVARFALLLAAVLVVAVGFLARFLWCRLALLRLALFDHARLRCGLLRLHLALGSLDRFGSLLWLIAALLLLLGLIAALRLLLRFTATRRLLLLDRKSTRLNSSYCTPSRMPSSA